MIAVSRRQLIGGASAAIIAAAAPRTAWGQTQADVVIVGAGLAGLFAAHRLEVAGLRTLIVEAESRVGGRMHTLDHLPGRPEAGGIQVGSGYKRLRAIADDLKVPLVRGGDEGRDALYRIRGETVSAAGWPSSTANRLPQTERATAPAALNSFYSGRLPKLPSLEAWTDEATIAELDRPWGEMLRGYGASAEAMRLIDANLNGNSIQTLSALHLARSAAIFRAGPGPTFLIGGGSQRLPEAMAKALASPVRLSTPVRAIREEADGVTVRLVNGERVRARHCICTIPFSALGAVALDMPEPLLRWGAGGLPYTHGTFIYLRASEPFWRSDGFPETLWSDDPVLARVFVLGDDPAMLKVFALGRAADTLDRLGPKRAGAEAIRRYEAARPSARGKLSVAGVWSWQRQPSARGIYHHLTPGMAGKLAALMQRTSGRLHFAGEHLALSASGMEAALESGERVARMIATRA